MADEANILTAWFKDVELSVDVSTIKGGIKHDVKQYPNRNTQSVEPLGLSPRNYSLDCVVSDRQAMDYFAYKRLLLSRIESNDPGQLIHPIDGRIDSVYAVSYSMDEDLSNFGKTTIKIDFQVDNNTGIPQSIANVTSQIASKNEVVKEAVKNDITINFTVSDKFKNNFSEAVSKVESVVDSVRSAISFVSDTSDSIDQFTADINDFADNAKVLVKDSSGLADEFKKTYEGLDQLYSDAQTRFDVIRKLFGFGADDITINPTTAALTERKSNNDLLNGSMSAASLSSAYLAATQIDYQTTDQIKDTTDSLDDQYDSVLLSSVDQSVKDAITDMRVSVLDALNEVSVTTPRVITVDTVPTTARLLAFDYYGNDDNGQTIIDLNDIADVSFISGSIDLVTL